MGFPGVASSQLVKMGIALDRFNPDQIRDDLVETLNLCDKHGCPVEFILKDISTVCYQPERIFEWVRIAMEVAGG